MRSLHCEVSADALRMQFRPPGTWKLFGNCGLGFSLIHISASSKQAEWIPSDCQSGHFHNYFVFHDFVSTEGITQRIGSALFPRILGGLGVKNRKPKISPRQFPNKLHVPIRKIPTLPRSSSFLRERARLRAYSVAVIGEFLSTLRRDLFPVLNDRQVFKQLTAIV